MKTSKRMETNTFLVVLCCPCTYVAVIAIIQIQQARNIEGYQVFFIISAVKQKSSHFGFSSNLCNENVPNCNTNH